jgi:hypothetical protein
MEEQLKAWRAKLDQLQAGSINDRAEGLIDLAHEVSRELDVTADHVNDSLEVVKQPVQNEHAPAVKDRVAAERDRLDQSLKRLTGMLRTFLDSEGT